MTVLYLLLAFYVGLFLGLALAALIGSGKADPFVEWIHHHEGGGTWTN